MESITQKGFEISIYTGETAPKDKIIAEAKKLVAAFPDVTNDFLILLVDRLTDHGFTSDRVRDAINHTIDTNPYKRPSIADIISFDRKVKTLSYEEVMSKCSPGYKAFDHHERITINGKVRYVEK